MKTKTFVRHGDLEMFLESPNVIVIDIEETADGIVLTYHIGFDRD